jgi:hypothetical protein
MYTFDFITINNNLTLFRGELSILYKTKRSRFSSLSGKQNSNKETPNRGIENSSSLAFNSLEEGYESIKFTFLGVAGLYMLINKKNPERFYIGSSENLARRVQEYIYLIKGIRSPNSISQEEIRQTPLADWALIILDISSPQLSLIHEQFALILWRPTINRHSIVIPRVNPQWAELDLAISQIKEYLSSFEEGSFGHTRFTKFLKAFTIAKELKSDPEYSSDKHLSNLVFVYDKSLPDKEPIVYSSINKALKSLFISHGKLMDCVAKKYVLQNSLVLSFEYLEVDDVVAYTEKPRGDNQIRKEVIRLRI